MYNIIISCFTVSLMFLKTVECENAGWKEYLSDNPTEFHDIQLEWQNGSKVPSWLSGTYVRNGPGQHEFGSDKRKMNNWLDGFPKLHSFKFDGEKVLFSGKMLESQNYLNSVAAGELTPQFTLNQFVDPADDWSIWERLEIFYKMLDGTAFDNFNPMVWRFGPSSLNDGIYMAVTDAPAGLRFNISDLSTLDVHMAPRYPPATTGCAHPLREPGSDNTINFMTKINLLTGVPYIEVQRYRPEDSFDSPQIITTFTPEKTSIVHSFSLTQDYAILFMYPLDVDVKSIFTKNFHLFDAMVWDGSEDTDVYVINLKDGDVIHLDAEPMYALHHANAYQLNQDEIIVDLCEQDHTSLHTYLTVEHLFNPPATTEWKLNKKNEFSRYKINLKTGRVSKHRFVNKLNSVFTSMFDFPMINENYRGKEYCFVYGVSLIDYTRTAIIKKNVCGGNETDKIWYKENHYLSEIWFFPTPSEDSTLSEVTAAPAEDDGVLMTLAYDGELNQSYMMLLDAKTLDTVATSYLPHNIPWSAHGYHFPEAQF